MTYFSTYDGLALLFSTVIFAVTIILLVARVTGFWITLLLLLFSLTTGLLVGNFNAFREFLQCNNEKKIEQLENEYLSLKEKVDQLQQEIELFRKSL